MEIVLKKMIETGRHWEMDHHEFYRHTHGDQYGQWHLKQIMMAEFLFWSFFVIIFLEIYSAI